MGLAGEAGEPNRATAAGSAPDLEALYEEYFADVRRHLRYLGVASAELDDALQEVFIVAHKRRDATVAPELARAWLLGIARNVARHHHRGRARRRRALDRLAEQPRRQPDGRELLERAAAAAYLTTFLETLELAQREAFVLVELEQLRGAELAAAIGTTEAAAWSRLRRARQAFERHFRALAPEVVEDGSSREAMLREAVASGNDAEDGASRNRCRGVLAPLLGWSAGANPAGTGLSFAALVGAGASQVSALSAFGLTILAGGGLVSLLAFFEPMAAAERSAGPSVAGPAPVSAGVVSPMPPPMAASTLAVVSSATVSESVASERGPLLARGPARSLGLTPGVAGQETGGEIETEKRAAPPQVQRPATSVDDERTLADEVAHLVHVGANDQAMRASIDYLSRHPAGRFEARVRALRVTIYCRQGKLAMAKTERALFLAASPEEALRRGVLLACAERSPVGDEPPPSPGERARLEAEFADL